MKRYRIKHKEGLGYHHAYNTQYWEIGAFYKSVTRAKKALNENTADPSQWIIVETSFVDEEIHFRGE